MKVLHWPRNSGKTTELIRISAETGYRIICPTEHQAENVARDVQMRGIGIPKPISIYWFINRERTPGRNYPKDEGYLIDDLDICLNQLFGREPYNALIKMVTISKACHKLDKRIGRQKDTDYCTEICAKCSINPDNKRGKVGKE